MTTKRQQREENLDRTPPAVASRSRLEEEVARHIARQPQSSPERAAEIAASMQPPQPIQGQLGPIMRELRALPRVSDEEAARVAAERDAEVQRELAAEKRKTRAGIWAKKCPGRFQEPFDWERVDPHASRKDLEELLAWTYQDRGLYVLGLSGHSKTRAVFTLLRRLYVEEGHTVHFLDGIRFANEAAAAWRETGETEGWLQELTKPRILFLDDLAKRWTKATEEAAFTVLDRRSAAMVPTFITLNYSGDQMREMSHDQGVMGPFLRRVRDYCDILAV